MNYTAMQVLRRRKTPEEIRAAMAAFERDIKPLRDLVVRTLSALPPMYRAVIGPGDTLELAQRPLLPGEQYLLDTYERVCRDTMKRHGLEPMPDPGG
jgi:hypothetical protein